MSGLLDAPVSAVMKKDFALAKKDDSLRKIFEAMAKKGMAFAPITDEFGVVVGTVSERDLSKVFNVPTVGGIVKFSDELIQECLKKQAREIMSSPAITLEETAPVSDALRIFANNHIHFIPVVNRGGVIVGIISLLDIIGHKDKA